MQKRNPTQLVTTSGECQPQLLTKGFYTMDAMQVKHKVEYRRPKPKNRLLVCSGVIVDPLLEIAVSDPIWRQWFAEGSPTTDYVPFQNVDASSVLPAEHREDWIGA